MNTFLFIGNLVHLTAFLTLIYEIIRKKSAAGISGKTQLLLTIVFICRYTDLINLYISFYNTFMKVTFITLSMTTLYMIYCKYGHTYDERNDTFWDSLLVIPAAVLAICVNYYVFKKNWSEQDPFYLVQDILWTFSIYLEALAIIPQHFLSRKTGDGTVLPYVILLGVYRSFYIMNWIFRYLTQNHQDLISTISGSVQTVILFIVAVDIYRRKEERPKWQQITDVFTVEAAKVGQQPISYVFGEKEMDCPETA
ncbi:ER lumen protein-retaining receptor 1-like [Anthonomus grandis grandis]|uniref:ER lumen protein-retaining receptor 1-like n=1 Tax=Anthonomus grandis grandis TaxID=2921223 RepID=UPI0021657ACD|nr:ER lumen protein-retaining receptor 1-like [Anthonomus grandis grandis]